MDYVHTPSYFFWTERIYIALTSKVQTLFTIKTLEILQITRKVQPRSRHFIRGHHRPPHHQAKPETWWMMPGRSHLPPPKHSSTPWNHRNSRRHGPATTYLTQWTTIGRCHSGVGNGRSKPVTLSSMRMTTRKHKNPRTGTHIPFERRGKWNKSHKPSKANRTHQRSPLTKSERQKPSTTNIGGSTEDTTSTGEV
jgi:hypothetical protein